MPIQLRTSSNTWRTNVDVLRYQSDGTFMKAVPLKWSGTHWVHAGNQRYMEAEILHYNILNTHFQVTMKTSGTNTIIHNLAMNENFTYSYIVNGIENANYITSRTWTYNNWQVPVNTLEIRVFRATPQGLVLVQTINITLSSGSGSGSGSGGTVMGFGEEIIDL